jgi:hypothetical protein
LAGRDSGLSRATMTDGPALSARCAGLFDGPLMGGTFQMCGFPSFAGNVTALFCGHRCESYSAGHTTLQSLVGSLPSLSDSDLQQVVSARAVHSETLSVVTPLGSLLDRSDEMTRY